MKRKIIILMLLLPMLSMAQEIKNKNFITSTNAYLGSSTHYNGYIPTSIYDSLGLPCDSVWLHAWPPSYFGFNNQGDYTLWGAGSSLHLTCIAYAYEDYEIIVPRGFAQPMHSDTLLKIGGVALYYSFLADCGYYTDTMFNVRTNVFDTICILDGATLQPLYEKVLNDTIDPSYEGVYEIIFDSAITVKDYYIAYKYCNKNIKIKDFSYYDPYAEKMIYHKEAFYSIPMYVYQAFLYFNNYEEIWDVYNNYTEQIRCLNDNYGWMEVYDFLNLFYPQSLQAIGGLTVSHYTDFHYPTPSDHPIHTTDLIVFGIKESAIIDSIDRPWLFTQDTTITDSTDTNFLSQIDLESKIAVQPNPTRSEVVISCPEPLREVALLNPMGQVLYREYYNQKRITLDLSSYPQGVYILHLQTTSGNIKKKVVRQ